MGAQSVQEMLKKTIESYKHDLLNIRGPDYVCTSLSFINVGTPIAHKHKCGYEWAVTPSHLLYDKTNCPKCAGTLTKTHQEYLEQIKNKDFIVLETYISGKVKILHKHIVCGYEWSIRPENIIYGQSCPNCIREASNLVYLIKILDIENLYKIGITNNITRRQKELGVLNELLWVETYDTEEEARHREKILLDKVKDSMYNSGVLKSGNTETFIIEDIEWLQKEWKYYG